MTKADAGSGWKQRRAFCVAGFAGWWHNPLMRNLILAAFVFPISACADMASWQQQQAACNAATTYGQMFGTPDNRGPCWFRTVGHAASGRIQVFTVETPGGNFAAITYDGNRMIGVSTSGGI